MWGRHCSPCVASPCLIAKHPGPAGTHRLRPSRAGRWPGPTPGPSSWPAPGCRPRCQPGARAHRRCAPAWRPAMQRGCPRRRRQRRPCLRRQVQRGLQEPRPALRSSQPPRQRGETAGRGRKKPDAWAGIGSSNVGPSARLAPGKRCSKGVSAGVPHRPASRKALPLPLCEQGSQQRTHAAAPHSGSGRAGPCCPTAPSCGLHLGRGHRP